MMDTRQRIISQLRADRAGLAGLVVVTCFFMAALGVWTGLWGQDWAAADGGRGSGSAG